MVVGLRVGEGGVWKITGVGVVGTMGVAVGGRALRRARSRPAAGSRRATTTFGQPCSDSDIYWQDPGAGSVVIARRTGEHLGPGRDRADADSGFQVQDQTRFTWFSSEPSPTRPHPSATRGSP